MDPWSIVVYRVDPWSTVVAGVDLWSIVVCRVGPWHIASAVGHAIAMCRYLASPGAVSVCCGLHGTWQTPLVIYLQ